mgnify:CR=1 FL=1|jgi:hypothetical protein|nr:MAG TPA: hypothetical protein [Caudoviricetes sp.]
MNTNYKMSEGGAGIAPLQLVHKRLGRWAVRWDFSPKPESEGVVTYAEYIFDHKPTQEEIRYLVNDYYNQQIETEIRGGFRWNEEPVWLSQENQFNYKAAYDLAVQTAGHSLPVTFKLGTDEEPVYHEFTTVDELSDFYTKAMQHVQDTLKSGWRKKDAFDYGLYE